MVYPPGRGGVPIHQADIATLDEGRYLNDRIIAVLNRWAMDRMTTRSELIQICDSFLYPQLVRGVSGELAGNEALQANFERIRRSKRQQGPGGKPLCIVPICEDQHWYMVIIWTQRQGGRVKVDLMTVDSLAAKPRTRVIDVITRYLDSVHTPEVTIQHQTLPVKQQSNGYVCGIHVIHNVRRIVEYVDEGGLTRTELAPMAEAMNKTPCPITRMEVKEELDKIRQAAANPTVEAAPDEESLQIGPGQALALDLRCVLKNRTDEVREVTAAHIEELLKRVATLRQQMEGGRQLKKCSLQDIGPHVVQYRLWRRSDWSILALTNKGRYQ